MYWAGHAAFDAVVHAAVTAVALATFAAFGDGATCGSAVQAVATFLLLLGYGLAVAPLSYACSLPFNSPSAAQVRAVRSSAGLLGGDGLGAYRSRDKPLPALLAGPSVISLA